MKPACSSFTFAFLRAKSSVKSRQIVSADEIWKKVTISPCLFKRVSLGAGLGGRWCSSWNLSRAVTPRRIYALFTCHLMELMPLIPLVVLNHPCYTTALLLESPQKTHRTCYPTMKSVLFLSQEGHFSLVPWSLCELMNVSAQHPCVWGTGTPLSLSFHPPVT